jgi:quinol monooxygenase YgiN
VENVEAVTVGLYVRLAANTGREEEVESFLREALRRVHDEQATVIRFAGRLDPSTFAIIDAFPDESGRQAHLAGQVASALNGKGPQLLTSEPTIERFDILAAKLPVVALQPQ